MDSVVSLATVFWYVTQRFVTYQKNGCKGVYGQCESGVELLRVVLSAFVFCIHHSFPCLYV